MSESLLKQVEDLVSSYQKAISRIETENKALRVELEQAYDMLIELRELPRLSEFEGVE